MYKKLEDVNQQINTGKWLLLDVCALLWLNIYNCTSIRIDIYIIKVDQLTAKFSSNVCIRDYTLIYWNHFIEHNKI